MILIAGFLDLRKRPTPVTVAFYMDHHVPAAVTEGLRRRAVDVVTVAEDGYETANDAAVRDLELVAKVLEPSDVRNRVVFLPLH